MIPTSGWAIKDSDSFLHEEMDPLCHECSSLTWLWDFLLVSSWPSRAPEFNPGIFIDGTPVWAATTTTVASRISLGHLGSLLLVLAYLASKEYVSHGQTCTLGINPMNLLHWGARSEITWTEGDWTSELLGVTQGHQLCLPFCLTNEPETRASLSTLGARAIRQKMKWLLSWLCVGGEWNFLDLRIPCQETGSSFKDDGSRH